MTALLLAAALALPDPQLTPGVVRPLSLHAICTVKWGRDRRHVTPAMRRAVCREYGKRNCPRGFEIDHLIPRELGGADDVRDLWPQPWPEARVKDREENALHCAVCAGRVSLHDAQERMRHWRPNAR